MRFICKQAEDSNITFYNLADDTPVLIIESDSYTVHDNEIKISLDDDALEEVKGIMGL
jgi:hypothetical protein